MNFKLIGSFLIAAMFYCGNVLYAVTETVYINSGTFTTVDNEQFSYLAFNPTQTFDPENYRITLNPGQLLELKVINNDSVIHDIDIKGVSGVSGSINPGDSITVTHTFNNIGAYIYYDPSADNRYLGLGGMIAVESPTVANFYWNIKEHQMAWNDSLINGNTVNWADYYPDYFTINGKSNPDINTDPNARVTGSVNDTIRIYITNTGQAAHSMHFHGYHATIISSDEHPSHTGRSKDTFPIESMETLVIEIVPDKTGEYPVHDHNLVAVTGGGMYPNGMFTTILIQ